MICQLSIVLPDKSVCWQLSHESCTVSQEERGSEARSKPTASMISVLDQVWYVPVSPELDNEAMLTRRAAYVLWANQW